MDAGLDFLRFKKKKKRKTEDDDKCEDFKAVQEVILQTSSDNAQTAGSTPPTLLRC